MENTKLNEAELVLAKILNYQNEPDAYNHPDVTPQWKEIKWLPYNVYQRFVKQEIINYFDSKNSPVHKELREEIKQRWKEMELEDADPIEKCNDIAN